MTDNNLDIKDSQQISSYIKNTKRLQEGYNIYQSFIFDLNGTLVHTFAINKSFYTFINNHSYFTKIKDNSYSDSRIGFFENEILKWDLNLSMHHHIELTKNDTIIFLSRESKNYEGYEDINFDVIYEVDKLGNILYNWTTYDKINIISSYSNNYTVEELLFNKKNKLVDASYFHINYIQSLPKTNLSNDPRFKEGNWLISVRNFDLLIILDNDTKEIVWHYGPQIIEKQHGSQMLKSGNILIFDNGPERGYSRVIEINPLTKEIVWQFSGIPEKSLYSKSKGFAQMLDNGNILITESDEQYVYEITKNKTIVAMWDFTNVINTKKPINNIYRVLREPKEKYDEIISNSINSRLLEK